MQTFGPYRVEGLVAQGGMGVIWRAVGPGGETVAIKQLRAGAGTPTLQLRRFEREAEALTRLEHPALVKFLRVGEHPTGPFLVMEWLEGEPLQVLLDRQGPLSSRRAVRLVATLCEALEHAHARGVLHRDVKPDNVVLRERDGVPVLVDFGLTRALDRADPSQALTRTGVALGTPAYWPPEQALGLTDRIGPRSDVYGLGALLYALLTGAPPHAEPASLLEGVIQSTRPPPAPSSLHPGLDPALDALVMRCLEIDPAARFPSAAALREALLAWEAARAEPSPRRISDPWLAAGAALLAALLLALGWRARPAAPARAPETPKPAVDPVEAAQVAFRAAARAGGRPPFSEACQALEALTASTDPGLRTRATLALAERLRRQGDFAAARAQLRALQPGPPQARYLSARLAELERRAEQARAAYEALAGEEPGDPWAALAAAAAARLAGAEQAPSLAERALEAMNGAAEARVELALALSAAGRSDAAAAQLERVREEAPDDPEPLLLLAALRLAAGQLDSATVPLERALDLVNPGARYPGARALRVGLALERGQPTLALELLTEEPEGEQDAALLALRAGAHLMAGATHAGERDAARALALDEAAARRALRGLGPEARRVLARLIEPTPPPADGPQPSPALQQRAAGAAPRARAWLTRAQGLAFAGAPWAEVQEALDRAEGLAPGDPVVLRERAWLAVGRGLPRPALAALATLREAGQDDPELDLLTGDAHWRAGRVAAALEAFDRAAARDDVGPAPSAARALACFLRREELASREAAARAVASQPDYAAALLARALCEDIRAKDYPAVLEAWRTACGKSDLRQLCATYTRRSLGIGQDLQRGMATLQDPEFARQAAELDRLNASDPTLGPLHLDLAHRPADPLSRISAGGGVSLLSRLADPVPYALLVRARLALICGEREQVVASWRQLRRAEAQFVLPSWDRREFERVFKAAPPPELTDPR